MNKYFAYLFQLDMVTIVATSFHTCILHYKMSHRRARVQQARRGAGSLGGLASSSLGGLASSSLGEGGPISVFAVTGVKWTFQRLLQPNGTES